MAIQQRNPVLYAINNLVSGRGTGVFRGVQVAPQLANLRERAASIPGVTPLAETFGADLEATKSLINQLVTTAARSNTTSQALALSNLEKGAAYWYKAAETSNKGPTRDRIRELGDLSASYASAKTTLDASRAQVAKYNAEVEARNKAINESGFLALAGPTANTVSPPVTAGQSLSATDLYTGNIESQMLGRKQASELIPEDDVVTGALQSSIYGR